MGRVLPRHTFRFTIFHHAAPPRYSTLESYWSTEGSREHEIVVIGHYKRSGQFKVSIASGPTIPIVETTKEQRRLIAVVREKLEQQLGCKVILDFTDTDWFTPTVQVRPQVHHNKWTPRFWLHGCEHCFGSLYLEWDIQLPAHWTCLHCGRHRKYANEET